MDQVSDFIAKIIKLACQNRISFARHRSHLHGQFASQRHAPRQL
jgi:hypothetical protein